MNQGPISKEVQVPKEDQNDFDKEGKSITDTGDDTKKKEFGSNKPEFKRPVLCKIVEASFQTDNAKIMIEKGKQLPDDKQYQKHWLLCTFKYKEKETGEEKNFDQSYGSIREYKDRLWMGTANNLAELKGLLEAFISFPIENIWEMPKELIGKECFVKSVPWEFGNNKGFTNKVQDFIEEKGGK